MSTKKASQTKSNKQSRSSAARARTAKTTKRVTSTPRSYYKKSKRSAAPNRFLCLLTLILFGVAGVIVVILIAMMSYFKGAETINTADATRFASEYSTVSKDNVFKYISGEQAIDIIEHGTGVVYIGFPGCPWCQAYAGYLNDVAKQTNLSKIYYYNIYEDRQNNTEVYQKLVGLLAANLQYNDDGNRYIYVPDAVFVVDGHIIGNDAESSKDTAGESEPSAYWTEERVTALNNRLTTFAQQVVAAGCQDSCNN